MNKRGTPREIDVLPVRNLYHFELLHKTKDVFGAVPVPKDLELQESGQEDRKVTDQEMSGDRLFLLEIDGPCVQL